MTHWIANPKTRSLIWLGCVLLMSALLAKLCFSGIRLETNILKLLPTSEHNPLVNTAVQHFAEFSSRKIVLLFGHTDPTMAREAATLAKTQLDHSGQFSKVTLRVESDPERAFYELYFPSRAGLLPLDLIDELESSQNLSPVLERMMETLYAPAMPGLGALLEKDPLLLFPLALKNLPHAPGQTSIRDGYIEITMPETTWVVMHASIEGSVFSQNTQEAVVQAINHALEKSSSAFAGVETRYSGVLKFAHASTRKAQREAGLIGTLSMLAVFALLLFTFRSAVQLVAGLAPIAIGILFALTGSILMFGELHLLTLGFGASMIGVCIDYTFHYFAEGLGEEGSSSPDERLRRILPGISTGLITSVIAYLGLCIAPFPGLQQMAVFSSIGLVGAFGTVVCWLPVWPQGRPRTTTPLALAIGKVWLIVWSKFFSGKRAYIVIVLLLALGITGALKLRPNDDVRALQPQDLDLLQNERTMQKLTGPIDISRFFIVQGDSEEDLLLHEETLLGPLKQLIAENKLEWTQGLAQFVPSAHQQHVSRDLLRRLYLQDTQEVMRVLSALGQAPIAQENANRVLVDTNAPLLTIRSFFDHGFSEPFRTQWLGRIGEQQTSIILLGGIHDEPALRVLGQNLPNVHYVDKVSEISDLFGRYRRLAGGLVAGSYLMIALFLLRRYGLRRFARVFLPPCTAAVGTLGLLGFAGQTITLFHVLALLLVLGIGIDYTIFFAESRSRPASIMLAVILSACTTMLSFGLLALSSTRALADFGLTVLIGILFGLLLAPMAVSSPLKRAGDSRATL